MKSRIPKGALLAEFDSLRQSGLLDENQDEGLDLGQETERSAGETRWQVRSLTEISERPEDEADDEPLAMPPEMRRRLEREAALVRAGEDLEEDEGFVGARRGRKRRGAAAS
jgi:hypothetical protein